MRQRPDRAIQRRCALMWGVHADYTKAYADINEQIERTLVYMRKKRWLKKGDRVVVSYGSPIWRSGTKTDSIRIGTA